MSNVPFDYLIVGAGPAGCVLANRLSADPACRVALLDAGPDYGPDPAAWPAEMLDPTSIFPDTHSWGHALAGRGADDQLALPRAKVFGGSTTINGCIWLRGSAADYDGWAARGNPGWSFDEMLPFFKCAENDPIGGPMHGDEGPVTVWRMAEADYSPIDRLMIRSAAELGLPYIEDFNAGPTQEAGIGPNPRNIADGKRLNAAFSYLAPARPRPNLTIIPDAEVDCVLFEGRKAVGVRTSDGTIIATLEVILSAGAYGSPAILMRSGIGPADHLVEHGIPLVVDRPGVGANLQDHPLVNGLMECVIAPGCEPAAATFMPTVIKAKTGVVDDEIDVHFYQGQFQNGETGEWNLWFSASLQCARSRGTVRLTGADPGAPLYIDHAYYSDASDLEAHAQAVELLNRLVRETELAEVIEPIPGKTLEYRDRDELEAKLIRQVGTTFHPSSTCAMGPVSDPMAVVDAEGRVHGVEQLRVVDASIFPTGPRANLHFPIVAAAEKIAAGMCEDQR